MDRLNTSFLELQSGDSGIHGHLETHTVALAVTFVSMVLVASVICRHFVPKVHTICLFLIGMGFFAIAHYICPGAGQPGDPNWMGKHQDSKCGEALLQWHNTYWGVSELDPLVVLLVLLPALLFEDATAFEWHVMKRSLFGSFLLAFPGVVLQAVAVGIWARWMRITSGDADEILLTQGIMLGAMISATDPVAVMTPLKALNAPERLGALIGGESLMNDGSAMVIFFVFYGTGTFSGQDAVSAVQTFVELVGWAIVVAGVLLAVLALALPRTRNVYVELFMILACVFGSFLVCEMIGGSGVLAVVFIGFGVAARGHTWMSPHNIHQIHTVVCFIGQLFIDIIFTIAGVECMHLILDANIGAPAGSTNSNAAISWQDVVNVFILYIFMQALRAAVVFFMKPAISYTGYKVTWKECMIIIVGGVRGAVSLSLSLWVTGYFKTPDPVPQMVEAYRRIAFYTSSFVLMTLLFNSLALEPVYKMLNVYEKPKELQAVLSHSMHEVEILSRRATGRLKANWFFFNLDWDLVELIVGDLRDLDFSDDDSLHKCFKNRKKMHDLITELISELSESEDFTATDHYIAKLRFQRKQRIREQVLGLQSSMNPLQVLVNWKIVAERPIARALFYDTKVSMEMEEIKEDAEAEHRARIDARRLSGQDEWSRYPSPAQSKIFDDDDEVRPLLRQGRSSVSAPDHFKRTNTMSSGSRTVMDLGSLGEERFQKRDLSPVLTAQGFKVTRQPSSKPGGLFCRNRVISREASAVVEEKRLSTGSKEKQPRLNELYLGGLNTADADEFALPQIAGRSPMRIDRADSASESDASCFLSETPQQVRHAVKTRPKKKRLQRMVSDPGTRREMNDERRHELGEKLQAWCRSITKMLYSYHRQNKISKRKKLQTKLPDSDRQMLLEDVPLLALHSKTMATAIAARYEEMFEAEIISQGAYRLLQRSTALQLECISGQLARYSFMTEGNSFLHDAPFLRDDNPLNIDPADSMAANLHQAQHIVQIIAQFRVPVMYLMGHYRPDKRYETFGFVKDCCLGKPTEFDVSSNYKSLMRIITCFLAWVAVHEDLLAMASQYPLFYISPPFRHSVRRLVEYVKSEILHDLCVQSGRIQACFIVHEHILASRLCLITKMKVLKKKVHDGLLPASVCDKILEEALEPSLQEMLKFKPTSEQIDKLCDAISTSVHERHPCFGGAGHTHRRSRATSGGGVVGWVQNTFRSNTADPDRSRRSDSTPVKCDSDHPPSSCPEVQNRTSEIFPRQTGN